MMRTFIFATGGARRSFPRHRFAHVAHELVEHPLVVTRSGRTFRVVLVRLDRQGAMRETFHRAIVQVARADVEVAAARDRALVEAELVVLAGDDDAPTPDVLDRMVRAVVPEWEARCGRSDGAPDQLVTETDAEDRHGTRRSALRHRVEEQLYVVRDLRYRGGIARSVANDDALGRPRQHLACARGRGKDAHGRAAPHQATDLVLFHAGVEQCDLRTAPDLPADATCLDHQRTRAEWCGGACLRNRLLPHTRVMREIGRHLKERTAQRTFGAKAPNERACVNTRDTGNAVLPQVGVEIDGVVTARRVQLADDERLDPWPA